ncbi:AMP-binding protein [Amycolatopsis sp. K13G38]|uniref:AMP-binding protein n=1 Tax=Amycolatopsis acididurans TaxID=2724524 RepID=A0ABX1J2A9_9PSEU|nr:AMP-binding protein [Amycolatopsis acididurans]NKQ52411.1 AMP-binding protein [Amycolatopsis acididurans]
MRNFSGYAARTPDRPAIIDGDAPPVTFAELKADANRLSSALLARGAPPGGSVVALLPNGRHIILAERAVTQLPLYFTPLNWHLTAAEMAYVVQDAGASTLLTVRALLPAALAAADEAGLGRHQILVLDEQTEPELDGAPTWAGVVAGQSAETPRVRSAGQRMLYTSGTTGRPKGVRRAIPDLTPEQAAEAVVARAALYHADHEDGRYLSVAPLYHAAPLAYAVQALEVGHTVRILPRWDALEALRIIENEHITWTYLVPLMFTQWLALEPAERLAHDVSSVRSVVHTAAPCPVPVKRAMIEWLGPVVHEIYGGTEGSATFISAEEWLAHPGSVGRARKNVALRILDEEGRDLPPGEIGRVFFANSAMAFEYHRDPDKTAASREAGFNTLGDIGYLDPDGYLFLCDRAADTIISGGVNIYPAEIEQALAAHPDVLDSCVVGAPDAEWGERVHAVVVPRRENVDAQALRAYLRGQIAGFKVPRTVEFRSEVPRSDVGKLLRRVLRAELWRNEQERI